MDYKILFQIVMTAVLAGVGCVLSKLDNAIKELSKHFTNHLQHHEKLAGDYEKKLAVLEERTKNIK